MLDMFGNELLVGDTVVYADTRIGTDAIALDMYEIMEVDDIVAIGELRSGDYIGYRFYLTDTLQRCALIRNPYKTAEAYYGEPVH